jgi:phage terminase large subunit
MAQVEIKIPVEYKALYEDGWRYVVYYGGRYSLKSYNVALSQLIRGRQKKMRFLDTREIQNSIKDSVHKLLADQIERYGFTDYEVTNDTIRNKVTGTEFIFRGLRHNINEIKSTEGVDEAWIEEGQSVTKQSLDILLPTIRKAGSRIVVTFNRVTELDPVYVKFVQEPQERCYTKHLNYDIAEKYGLMTDAIRQEIEHDKKTDPALYAHKWLGQPLAQGENSIIGREAILEAMNREVDDDGAIEVGVDVARMGNDRTEFVKRKGLREVARQTFTKLRTTEVCDRLEGFVDGDKTVLLKIDDTGVGGGVTDEMMKRGYNVMAINFGAKPNNPDKYPNLISEAWFYMAEIMPTISLQMDNDLLMELSSRKWVMDSKGRRGVESKDQYKKRGFRSPDKADATILCFYTPEIKVTQWATADDM